MQRSLSDAVAARLVADGASADLLPVIRQAAELTITMLRQDGRLLPELAGIAADPSLPSGPERRFTLVLVGQLYEQHTTGDRAGRRTLKVVSVADLEVTLRVVATERETGRTGHEITLRRTELAGANVTLVGYEPDVPNPDDYVFPSAADFAMPEESGAPR